MSDRSGPNLLGIRPKAERPQRPWNVTFVCVAGLIHAIVSLVLTVVGVIVQQDLHLEDPVGPLVHWAVLSTIWGLFGVLVVLPFVWVLTLKGSRHARAVLVVALVVRVALAAIFMRFADVDHGRYLIAVLVVVDVVAVVLLFGGHRTSTYFAKSPVNLPRPAGDYGLDAPLVPILSLVGGIALLVYSAFLNPVGMVITTLCGMLLCLQAMIYLYTSLRGKFLIWRDIFADLPPPQRVLDVGCGRGMGVLMALQTWPEAVGDGLDLWRSRDQSGNSPQAITQNATETGVLDRLRLHTGDMAQLPFPDDSFDLVIANVAIQNVKSRAKRDQTLAEIYRVTAPGGRIRIVDIQYVRQYAARLGELGAVEIEISYCGPRGWFGNPAYASRLVSAAKPVN